MGIYSHRDHILNDFFLLLFFFLSPSGSHDILQLHAILCLLSTAQAGAQIDFWWEICPSRISFFYHKFSLDLMVCEMLSFIIKTNNDKHYGKFAL